VIPAKKMGEKSRRYYQMGYNDAIKNINLKNNMEKTFKELNELDTIIGNLYQTNPELKDGKFGYAYKRFSEKNFFPIFKD